MPLILLQLNTQYHDLYEHVCLLRAPDGDSLERRIVEFAHLTGLPLHHSRGGLDYSALLQGQRGPQVKLPWSPTQEPDLPSHEQEAFQAQLNARLLQLFGETLHPVVAFARWLERSCGWETVEHQHWGVGQPNLNDTLGPLTPPIEIESHRHRPAPTDWPLQDLMRHFGYPATDEELLDLHELGWADPGLRNVHAINTLFTRVGLFLRRRAQQVGIETTLRISPVTAAEFDDPSRPGRTPLGRAAGHRRHYEAAINQIQAAFNQHPDTLRRAPLAPLTPAQHKLLNLRDFLLHGDTPHPGPRSQDRRRTVTTGDYEAFPEAVQALVAAGRWPVTPLKRT